VETSTKKKEPESKRPNKKKEVLSKNDDPRLHKVVKRNEEADNDLLDLGKGLIETQKGKAPVNNAKAKTKAEVTDYYAFRKS